MLSAVSQAVAGLLSRAGMCHTTTRPSRVTRLADSWQGFRGKKALSEGYQAITLLLFRALNNKYLQKRNGSSAPSLTSEAELSLV